MNKDIMHFAPGNWDRNTECGHFNIEKNSDEFLNVQYDLVRAIKNSKGVKNLTRIQNVYDFGQYLMRSQIVVISSGQPLYKVRRYVAIPLAYKDLALKHNLDHRRLNMNEFTFQSHLNSASRNDLIFVVSILTHDQKSRSIKPYNFTEYYIDYVAEMEFY